MPAGLLVTVPPQERFTLSVYVLRVKIAEAVLFASIVKLHVPVPLHAPAHPVKVEPVAGVAVRVTADPVR